MVSPGIPLSNTWVDADESSPLMMPLQICPKPRFCITSRRKGHDTESKALDMSILRRIRESFF
jgi:hypothetical protein